MGISTYKTLEYFLGRGIIPRLNLLDKYSIDFESCFFLNIEDRFPLYEASNLPFQSLKRNWEYNYKMIEDVIDYLEKYWGIEVSTTENYINFYMDNEIFYDLSSKFLHVPFACCPIYIVTTGEKEFEKIVYIGKTSSKKNRFKGGHSVALKLHHPKYNGLKKNIYFASVMLLNNEKEYIPLEFISTFNGAEKMLLEVEASLIYYFKPELNVINKKRANYDMNSLIHIQNNSQKSYFLNDKFIGV